MSICSAENHMKEVFHYKWNLDGIICLFLLSVKCYTAFKGGDQMIPYYSTLLNQYRIKMNYTLADLEYRVGYTSSYLGKLERGEVDSSYKAVRQISRSSDIPMYTSLLSLRKSTNGIVKLEEEVSCEELSIQTVLDQLDKGIYSICSTRTLWISHAEDEQLTDLNVLTGITEERLDKIRRSFNDDGIQVSLPEALEICRALNEQFSTIFAVTSMNMFDHNSVNVAFTLQLYIEKQKNNKKNQYSQLETNLSKDEIDFLNSMLAAYRKLKLKPQKEELI